MGHNFASDLAESSKMGMLKLEIALMTHLQYNHYPPVPSSMVQPCKRAIEYANRGEYNHKIRLPKDVTYKGVTLAPVYTLIENFHLDCFLDQEDEDY